MKWIIYRYVFKLINVFYIRKIDIFFFQIFNEVLLINSIFLAFFLNFLKNIISKIFPLYLTSNLWVNWIGIQLFALILINKSTILKDLSGIQRYKRKFQIIRISFLSHRFVIIRTPWGNIFGMIWLLERILSIKVALGLQTNFSQLSHL